MPVNYKGVKATHAGFRVDLATHGVGLFERKP
jgi:hypothetical protein